MVDRPSSVVRAMRLNWLLLVLGAFTTALTVVLNDALIRAWAQGRSDMRRILETQGLQAIKDGAVRPPAFVPVAIVLFIVVALLVWMLVVFLGHGVGWARWSLTLLLFFTGVATVAGIRTGPPTIFVVLASVSIAVAAVAIVLLWHPDTSRYVSSE
jgi:hypothetical protein